MTTVDPNETPADRDARLERERLEREQIERDAGTSDDDDDD